MSFEFEAEVNECFAKVNKEEYKWVILMLKEGTDNVVTFAVPPHEKTGDEQADFDAFKAAMPEDQPRWVFYNLHFEKGGVDNHKILFINYVPDDCTSMKAKFPYAQNKEVVAKKLNCNKEIGVNDKADLTRDKLIDEF